ncbi:MAG: PAS domain-containing protein [Rhodospirillales bacterium]|nr:PAS domain-containing protein [Rhodospirillales bacterium]
MNPDLLPAPPFPAARHWKIAALWDYWIGVYANVGHAPRRADIDPVDIPRLLPNLWLADWDAASARFRYRLVGTGVTKARNIDATGHYLDEDFPDLAQSALGRSLEGVVASGRAAWSCALPPVTRTPNDIVRVERLSLPLSDGAGGVAMVLNLSVCTMRDGTTI